MNREELRVYNPENKELRTDVYIASLGLFSRSQIRHRQVRVLLADGRESKMSRRLKDGEPLVLEWDDPPSTDILPEALPLDVIWEDSDVVIVNKPQGMVVHPAPGHLHHTLVQGLLYRYAEFESAFEGDRVRPGIVHRLDKDTSGVMAAAKNPASLEALAAQFRDRSVEKSYLAVVRGHPPEKEGRVDESIGRDPSDRRKFAPAPRGRTALTHYRVLAATENLAYLSIRILTGRTHQVRVHMRHLGCPILGDPLYGRKDPGFPEATLMLHSWKLNITLPSGERRGFRAPLPPRFRDILSGFKKI